MRSKSRGKRRVPPSVTVTMATPFFSAIPLLSDQRQFGTALFDDHDHESEGGVDMHYRTICICCDEGEREVNRVLVCSERGCPVTVHANCLASEPKFDDFGNFFCPYCCFKRALDTCQGLRDKAVAAKRALSRFLDSRGAAARVNQLGIGEEIREDTRVGTDSAASARVDQVRIREDIVHDTRVGPADREEMVEATRVGADSACGGAAARVNQVPYREEMVKDIRAGADTSGGARVNLVHDCEEIVEDSDTEKSKKNTDEGKVNVTTSSVSETNDLESEAISEKKRKKERKDGKKVALARKLVVPEEHDAKNYSTIGKFVIEEEVTSFRTVKLQQQRMKQGLLIAKRRRLFWTAEEEKILKEGVLKFSTENQNIPWRKILEFGCHVFDKTRTPVDLKDKWKNIISKEGWKN